MQENWERICRGFKTNAKKIALLRKIMFGDPPAWAQNGEAPPAPADSPPCGMQDLSGTDDYTG